MPKICLANNSRVVLISSGRPQNLIREFYFYKKALRLLTVVEGKFKEIIQIT